MQTIEPTQRKGIKAVTIDIFKCYQTEPKPREYILPGLVPATVGSIVSPGGQGKSILALMLAHLVGGGADLLNFGTFPTGRVVYLSAEDNEDTLHERLYHIGSKLDNTQQERCSREIYAEDLTKVTPDLTNGELAGEWRRFIEQQATETRLLILDTLRNFHSSDENNSTAMSILISYLRGIAARTGCTILFLHHTNKLAAINGQGDTQQASRGSSVLTDNIRWQGYLSGMTSEESGKFIDEDGQLIGEDRGYYVRFGISKQNYGLPFTERWLKRGKGGILEPVTLSATARKLETVSSRKENKNGQRFD
jgi:regulatory protein RepA